MAELKESRDELAGMELEDRVLRVDRVRKTVKGGRIPSSRVMVAVGDGRGRIGIGMGKARQAPDAIRKGIDKAKKTMITVPLDGLTIPHPIHAKVGGAEILLKPASRGTGIIAGGAVRHIVELAGIRDILSKSLGSQNVLNRAKACFAALKLLQDPEDVARRRGKSVREMTGREVHSAYGTSKPPSEEPVPEIELDMDGDDM
ncbi:MAG: 30S ribosomal protein S5 [Armatimonadetes bacterium]|nr:30S ribosomal protein S5 [Armatimonadota bacterium]